MSQTVREIMTETVVTLPRSAPCGTRPGPVDRAVQLMRQRAIRRLPVVEGSTPIGIISIGDLAIELDENSGLADISAADSDN